MFDMLTEREKWIVQHLMAGITTNKELSQRLCLSPRTVQTHLSNAYKKLNVHSRAQLIVLVVRQGGLTREEA